MISFYQHYINPFFKLWHHFGLRIALNEVSFVLHRKRCPATHGKDMQTIRKYYSLIRYLGSKYKEIIDPYVEIRPKQRNGKIIEENAPIWTFWEQGFEKAPEVVKACQRSIDKVAGKHPVMRLDGKNVHQYLLIPDYVMDKRRRGIIGSAHYSDLIRFMLIARYGGFWVDAANYFVSDDFFRNAIQYHFYSVKGFDNDVSITRHLWLDGIFGCGKDAVYPKMMEDLLLAYWKKEDYAIDYFFDSCFQNAAYVRIMSLRRMFDAYPYNNTEIFALRLHAGEPYDEAVWYQYLQDTSVFNLTYKVDYGKNNDSFYQHLVNMQI